jgi:predicted acyltransferase
MGCVSFLLCLVPSILAVVFGYVSKAQIDQSGGAQTGRGLAVAGIVLGWVGIGIALVAAILFVILAAAGTSTAPDTHSGTETLRSLARVAQLT